MEVKASGITILFDATSSEELIMGKERALNAVSQRG